MRRDGFQHQALIYDGSADFLAGVLPFVAAALEAEEPVLVATGADRNELLAAELGPDAEGVRFVDMRAVGRNPASIIPFWQEFLDECGDRPVRGVGEPVWAERSEAALRECKRHEALLNLAFADGTPWSLLCPYDARTLPEEVLGEVGCTHSQVGCGGEMQEHPDFDPHPDVLGGELPPPRVEVQSLGFGLSELTEVRIRVASVAERAGLGPGAVADLVTATSELAANSVMHGGGSGVLRLWSEDDSLLAEVEDRGRIEEPLVGRLRPDLRQEGGRGLWLANQLCDLVQIRSNPSGTVVRLHVVAREPALV